MKCEMRKDLKLCAPNASSKFNRKWELEFFYVVFLVYIQGSSINYNITQFGAKTNHFSDNAILTAVKLPHNGLKVAIYG